MKRESKMSQSPRLTRVLLFVLLAILLLVATSIGLSLYFGEHAHHGSLMMFDEDVSDSAVAWFVAIPVVVVALAIAALVTILALVLAMLALVLAVTLGLVAALVGIMLALMPIAVFLAIPVLAIYGFVKLMQRNNRPPVAV
jgi:hypothetical protein